MVLAAPNLGIPTQPPALQALGLHVPRGKRDVVIDINLDVHVGKVIALIGPNGSGKTTLLKALAGLIPSRGQINVQGQALNGMDHRQRAQRVAYVPQVSALNSPLSVRDVVAQGRLAHTSSLRGLGRQDHEAIDEAIVATDVTGFVDRSYTALSHGERHRVLIARGLATQAPVLLLDEPTAGLDLQHVLGLLGLIKKLCRAGRAVLVVLHPIEEVRQAADEVAVISGGRLVARGPTAQILSAELVRTIYNVRVVVDGAWSFQAV